MRRQRVCIATNYISNVNTERLDAGSPRDQPLARWPLWSDWVDNLDNSEFANNNKRLSVSDHTYMVTDNGGS